MERIAPEKDHGIAHVTRGLDRLLEETYRAEQAHFWWRGFRRFVRPLLVEATRGIVRPRLLDCGCGTGANLELLRQFGPSYGFDVNAIGLQFGRAAGRSGLARASITHVPFRDAVFDVVTSFDVLSMLPEDDEAVAVAEMHRVLRPGGALILNLAAMDILRRNHSRVAPEIRRYTSDRVRTLLEPAGFRVVRLTHTNATLFPLMLGVRVVERLASGARLEGGGGLDFAIPVAPLNALLSGILALEARVLAHADLPFGSSILCLARK